MDFGPEKRNFGRFLEPEKPTWIFFAIILWTSGQKKQFGFSGSFQKIFGIWARQAKHENFMITLITHDNSKWTWNRQTDKQNLAGCNSSKQVFGLAARQAKLENFMITLNGLRAHKQNLAGCNSPKQEFGPGTRLTSLEILLQ